MSRPSLADSRIDVVIIGAGPGGLVSCKAMLDAGITNMVVLEATASVGGVWRGTGGGDNNTAGSCGLTWDGMVTNLSREKCAFSDLEHLDTIPDFPSAIDMANYFERYATTFELKRFIHFSSRVVAVDPGSPWRVSVEQKGADGAVVQCELSARYVVVASGVFARPWIPAALRAPIESAGIPFRHACGLKRPIATVSRRVLVVGAAYTGADLAVALANEGHAVTVLAHRPRWYLSRYVTSSDGAQQCWDRVMEQRTSDNPDSYRNGTRHAIRHAYLSSLLPNPGDVDEQLRVVHERDASLAVVADGFLEAIAAARIRIVTELPDHPEDDFDEAIFATGYRSDLSFLSSDITVPCEVDESSDFLPLLLYKSTLHPTLPTIAFVGLYRGPYMPTLEVQARWIAAVASGSVAYPTDEVRSRQLVDERRIREFGACTEEEIALYQSGSATLHKNGFPHPNYIGFTDALAEEYGARPTLADFPSLRFQNVVASQYRLRS